MITFESSQIAPTFRPGWNVPANEGDTQPISSFVHLATSVLLGDQLAHSTWDSGTTFIRTDSLPNIAYRDPASAACAVIDLDLFCFESGALQSLLAGEQRLSVVLVGTCTDARLPVRALKAGAVDFFPKPFDVHALQAAITTALASDRRLIAKRQEIGRLKSRMALLTPREREVLPLVVGGLLNKQAAALLGISEITLQIHRGQVMRKMQAASLPDLVRMCMKLRVRHWRQIA